MKRLAAAVLAAAWALSIPALSSQAPGAGPEEVNKLFARWTKDTPGCAVGAEVNGATTANAAYGMADLERDVPNTPQTIFEAGSVAKQFTAAAVLLLARDGKLGLDDPVRQFIPELPDYGTPITIRQMLTHTSGLRDWGNIGAIQGWPRSTRAYTHAHVLDIVSRQKAVNFTPGTRWSYSNSGYNLAAILVSRVSGMSFADFTRTRIFEPLGMTRTSWRDDHTRIVKNRAVAYAPVGASFRIDMPFENVHGNGGLLTTVSDLVRWIGNFQAPRVGDAAFVRLQQEPGRFTSGKEHNYAFGLVVGRYKGVREVAHGGATAGYRAYLAWYPDQKVSVAVLCNVGVGNVEQTAHAVAEVFLGDAVNAAAAAAAAIPEAQGPLAALARDESYRPRPEDLAALAGSYVSDEAETTLVIRVESDQLVMSQRGGLRAVLTPRAKDIFASPGGALVFRRDAAAGIEALSVVQDRVWDLRFQRQARPGGSF